MVKLKQAILGGLISACCFSVMDAAVRVGFEDSAVVKVKKAGSIMQASRGLLGSEDLVIVERGGARLEFDRGGVMELGEGAVLKVGEDFSKVLLYSGGIRFSALSGVKLHVAGADLYLDGASGWVASRATEAKLTLDRGRADVFGVDRIKTVDAGSTLLIKSGELNAELSQHRVETPVSSMEDVAQVLDPVKTFKERISHLGRHDLSADVGVQTNIMKVMSLFDAYAWKSLLEKGREQLFAQDVASLDASWPILPAKMKRHFLLDASVDALFDDLALFEAKCSGASVQEKNAMSFFVRQALVEELITKRRWFSGLSGRINVSTAHDSNVAETADSDTLVSRESGSSLSTNMKMTYTARKQNWGLPSYELKFLEKRYFDNQFEPREYSQFGGRVKGLMDLEGDVFQSFGLSFGLKSEFLNSRAGRDPNMLTYSTQLEWITRPKKEWGAHSDLFLAFLTLGFEYRDYFNGKNIDFLAKEKNVIAPSFSAVGVNIKKVESWRWTEMAVLSLQAPNSDSSNLEYQTTRLDLSVGFEKELWELKPSLAFSYRDQDKYDYFNNFGNVASEGRRDKVYEYGLMVTKKQPAHQMDVRGAYRRIRQDSSMPRFSYGDHRWTLAMSKGF